MDQDHRFHDVGRQQTEQELFDSFLNLCDNRNYNDVWQPDPSYQFSYPESFTGHIPNNDTVQPIQSFPNQSKPLDLCSQLSLDSWEPHPLFPQPKLSGRGVKSRRSLSRKKSTYTTPRVERTFSPLLIPNVPSQTPSSTYVQGQLDPLQRWRDSPPEHEPAAIAAIHRALQDTPIPYSDHVTSWSPKAEPRSTSAPILPTPFHTYRQASSRASSESGFSESSQLSTTSTKSHNLSHLHTRRAIKTKRSNTNTKDKDPRRFKCTFCCESFRTKYDWTRHEKSLHFDPEEWRCSPNGSMVFSALTDRIHCAYCNALDPTLSHLESHNYAICDSPTHPTTFHRKDHLVQHLRLAHHLESLPLIDDWKVSHTAPLTSRCGFCDTTLTTWDERANHLSEHFRQGDTMADWRGDHGFDPAIAGKIRNAIPPYIIADESRAIIPFKAGDARTQDHFNQISRCVGAINLGKESKAGQDLDPGIGIGDLPLNSTEFSHGLKQNQDQRHAQAQDPGQNQPSTLAESDGYLDILTRHLGRFAREQMVRGVLPTDAMFQNEARKLIFDGDADGWDTTLADNEYWLREFKAQFGGRG